MMMKMTMMMFRPSTALLTRPPHCNAPRAGEVGRPRAPGWHHHHHDFDDDDDFDYGGDAKNHFEDFDGSYDDNFVDYNDDKRERL